MKLTDIVYLGIHLDTTSRVELLQEFIHLAQENGSLPKYGKLYCDHITVQFGYDITTEWLKRLGETNQIKIGTKFIWAENVVYLPVSVDGVENAHITIATNGMTSPVFAKEHLEKNPYGGDYLTSVYKGTLVAYLKDGRICCSL
jgi:hypothetical protein